MKNKIISIILFLVLIVSICGNIYQFNLYKNINNNINSYKTELNDLNDNIDTLNNELTAKNNEVSELSTKITELETSIDSLQTENDSLLTQINDLELELLEKENSVAVTENNDTSFDTRADNLARALIDDYRKNHPETNTNNQPTTSGEPVELPDDGWVPEFDGHYSY